MITSEFSLAPGERIRRSDLHKAFGGSNQGGLIPSSTTPNIFLFADPLEGPQHGYVDGWKDDGCFHYTGSGQLGDQEMIRGNKALLNHKIDRRRVRLFKGSRDTVTYDGEFDLNEEAPWYETDAPETNDGPTRKVIVFRLRPVGEVIREGNESVGVPMTTTVTSVEVEVHNTEKMVVNPKSEVSEAERREAKLVAAFKAYLERKGHPVTRNKISIAGEAKPIYTDAFIVSLSLLVEAKGTCERGAFRMAIGQLADYRRFLTSPRCCILLPSKPRPDLLELAWFEGLDVIWQTTDGFTATMNLP